MEATRRYWDGERWTEHVAPDEQGGRAPVKSREATARKVDPTFAWAMALSPLLLLAGLYLVPALTFVGALGLLFAGLTVVLAFLDASRLRRAGVEISGAWSLLLGGIYLVVRTSRAKTTPAIPVVWFATWVVAVVAAFTFASVTSYDESEVEQEIESWVADNGVAGASVDCPHDLTGRVGDTMTCFAQAPSVGGQTPVTVTIAEEGYTWDFG